MAVEDMHPGTRDTRLLERALRERWPIPEQFRAAVVKRLLAVIAKKNAKPREIISASRALFQADSVNIEAEKEVIPQQHLHLHQDIDLQAISTEELKRIEGELIALSRRTADDKS